MANQIIKVCDINEYYSNFTFLIRKVFLATSNPISYQGWNQYVQNAFQFEEVSYFTVSIYKLSFLFQLLRIYVSWPY